MACISLACVIGLCAAFLSIASDRDERASLTQRVQELEGAHAQQQAAISVLTDKLAASVKQGEGMTQRLQQLEEAHAHQRATIGVLTDKLAASVKYGDGVSLQTWQNVYLGATNGRGTINTGTPGAPERTRALGDERFIIGRNDAK
jgi:uncharacterized coiled-coil protein SlyX